MGAICHKSSIYHIYFACYHMLLCSFRTITIAIQSYLVPMVLSIRKRVLQKRSRFVLTAYAVTSPSGLVSFIMILSPSCKQ